MRAACAGRRQVVPQDTLRVWSELERFQVTATTTTITMLLMMMMMMRVNYYF